MPILKSAKKALRQSFRKRAGNLIYKDKIKALFKEAKSLVAQKKTEDAKKLLPQIYKALDKAAKVGMVKKNNASRRKSRIAKLIARLNIPNK